MRLCVATGVAGLSIEDSTGDRERPLYELDAAVARIRAARSAIDASRGDTILTARAESFPAWRPDLDDVVRRLRAARPLAERGSFEGFADATPHPELNAFFRDDARKRAGRG